MLGSNPQTFQAASFVHKSAQFFCKKNTTVNLNQLWNLLIIVVTDNITVQLAAQVYFLKQVLHNSYIKFFKIPPWKHALLNISSVQHILVFPAVDLVSEATSAQIMASYLLLVPEFLLYDSLGRNASVINARNPQCHMTTHPMPREHNTQRIINCVYFSSWTVFAVI